MKLYGIPAFIVALLILGSCNYKQAERTKDNRFKLNSENVNVVIPELHSISEIKAVFDRAEVDLYPELINESSNASLYYGRQKLAANLGAYLGDLVYVLSTDGEKKSGDTYKAIIELSEKFDVAAEILSVSRERLNNEMSSADEFVAALETILENSSSNLSESEVSEFNSYLIFGNYIEKMYIVSSLCQRENSELTQEQDVNARLDLLSLLANQSSRVNELIYILSKYPDELTNVVALDELSQLLSLYTNVEASRDKLLKKNPSDVLKANEITAIFNQVEKIRNRLVLP